MIRLRNPRGQQFTGRLQVVIEITATNRLRVSAPYGVAFEIRGPRTYVVDSDAFTLDLTTGAVVHCGLLQREKKGKP